MESVSELDELTEVRRCLDQRVEARFLWGWTAKERQDYQRLVERESELLLRRPSRWYREQLRQLAPQTLSP